ncbi:amidophosphoribosyltransferase [Aquirufa antheringensis]|jgi:amidophosphoribosyltransferase|uniref:Amidophosphoribosyltransferase n=1 Tax=Aquirufa antheringensis TaxID=2516559 RepID=A0A4Q9B9E9_9BACT|nr:amidophosphoribosyltransferase [Aquirufa antheringensis]MCE4215936.1 amidophosphoribosyltransferase [Pseudarcicella sp. GAP-15]MCL9968021.1 amidophosphoribosyltransferase [Aquirufa antheringensis]MCZ2477366.1 amidophosphoribosyltransferase [Aquirufa antheringensis]MCZ2485394.1 amidophosphoribosyltransferase [Aquirufa antheringensis]MCZ2488209.1 amidophosphoribosyltransferase [Aquirufa antheringensis]
MSDSIKHECGIALIRLRKPFQHYLDKYKTPTYGLSKLYLMMEKQVNRGQDGAGVANIKINVKPGHRYISRYRSVEPQAVADIFGKINKKFAKAQKLAKSVKRETGIDAVHDADWWQENVAFTGEVLLGHLRYGTHGQNEIENCHPMLRQNNWRSRNLVMAGNFNMTNVDDLFDKLVSLGQHPKEKVDTVTVMEKIGHFLDEENQRQFGKYKDQYENPELSDIIAQEIDLKRVLERSCKDFDGGYAMVGMTGYGASFVARDPAGIRPAFYYVDEEVAVVASEKQAIKTSFNCAYDQIKEITPGHALIIDIEGNVNEVPFIDRLEQKSCSFERIYFSRGSDPDIYHERKKLGQLLIPQILEEVHHDLKNTVFSYIPNTAETAFLGMIDGLEDHLAKERKNAIMEGILFEQELEELLTFRPRVEKLISKDVKVRTFITSDAQRDDMVAHVYDTTYEVINKEVDSVVIIDDSIVRGTTLEKSILKLLDKLSPKKIVIVSSAPQIRYPDCYGIDMSKMKEFVAFRAALALLKERGLENILDEVNLRCLNALENGTASEENFVKAIYAPFTDEEISNKIAEIVRPKGLKAELSIVYQTVANLNVACPDHLGDWYFTGNFPTPGGNQVVNKSFVNFMKGIEVRAY